MDDSGDRLQAVHGADCPVYTVGMGLSEEDRKRIEEEEYRRALREKYERELRGKAEVRADTTHQVDVRGMSAHFVQADTSHQVEVRGVSTEIYRDAKHGVATGASAVLTVVRSVRYWVVSVLYWVVFVVSVFYFLFGLSILAGLSPLSNIKDVRIGSYISTPLAAVVLAALIWTKRFRHSRR